VRQLAPLSTGAKSNDGIIIALVVKKTKSVVAELLSAVEDAVVLLLGRHEGGFDGTIGGADGPTHESFPAQIRWVRKRLRSHADFFRSIIMPPDNVARLPCLVAAPRALLASPPRQLRTVLQELLHEASRGLTLRACLAIDGAIIAATDEWSRLHPRDAFLIHRLVASNSHQADASVNSDDRRGRKRTPVPTRFENWKTCEIFLPHTTVHDTRIPKTCPALASAGTTLCRVVSASLPCGARDVRKTCFNSVLYVHTSFATKEYPA
jgi:hypothetical protein